MSKIVVTFRVVMDGEKLDSYVRDLYAGPPDDPCPGEPRPGVQVVVDWVEEARQRIKSGDNPDWWWATSNDYVDYVDVDVQMVAT